jgi:hypothetical protein
MAVEDKPEYYMKEALLVYTFKKKKKFGKQNTKADSMLKLSTQPYYFQVSKGAGGCLEGIQSTKTGIGKAFRNRNGEQNTSGLGKAQRLQGRA